MEKYTENAPATWITPQCPFTIEYALRALDDIRLAVMDAFFSLPRGGAEIGGVLLGSHSGKRLVIADYEPLECEHAFGPGFTLSERDRARLSALLASSRPAGLDPVGWYHSHTRSEIFLSESDLEIHNRYFPASWQVALVMKPHTFQPMRAGFFFREPGGQIRASASYREFQLQALPIQPVPAGTRALQRNSRDEVQPAPIPETHAPRPAAPEVITVTAEPEVEPAPAPEPVPVSGPAAPADAPPQPSVEAAPTPAAEAAPEPDIPGFLQTTQKPRRRWWKPVTAVAAGLAIGTAAYEFRQAWLPQVLAGFQHLPAKSSVAAASERPAPLGLSVTDDHGELQIHWDRNSAAMQKASNALIEVVDSGAPPRAIPLDDAHLRSGAFTYVRQGERVDVALSMDEPGAQRLRESTTFLGPAPLLPQDVDNLRRERDDLARHNLKLESDLKAAEDHNRRLQKSLDDVTKRLRDQQRRRLENQVPK